MMMSSRKARVLPDLRLLRMQKQVKRIKEPNSPFAKPRKQIDLWRRKDLPKTHDGPLESTLFAAETAIAPA